MHWLAWLPHALAVYANTAPLPPLRVRAAAWGGLYQQDGHRDGERRQGCKYTNCGFLLLPGLKLVFRLLGVVEILLELVKVETAVFMNHTSDYMKRLALF